MPILIGGMTPNIGSVILKHLFNLCELGWFDYIKLSLIPEECPTNNSFWFSISVYSHKKAEGVNTIEQVMR